MTSDSHPSHLPDILELCWHHLQQGVQNRRSGFHFPVVSTVDLSGKPKGRVVILREAIAAEKFLRFNSDLRTNKWQELRANPSISMTFYDESERVQLRIEGVAVLNIGDEIASQAWQKSQRMSRIGYGSSPGPGSNLEAPDAFILPMNDEDIALGFANFGTIAVAVEKIEWLYLKAGGNRRALFDVSANTAQWMVP